MLAGGGPAVYEFQVQDGPVTADGWQEAQWGEESGARVGGPCDRGVSLSLL